MTCQHDRHAHVHTALAHPYWRRIEQPILSQLREPECETRHQPSSGRILRSAADDAALRSQCDALQGEDLAVSAALQRLRAHVHVAAGYGYERDDAPPDEFLPMREGHTTPKARSMWKRRPGTFKRWAQS